MATASPFAKLFSKPREEPYFGKIEFFKKTLCFSDTIILRQNISRVEKYGVKKIHRIPFLYLIVSIAIAVISLFFPPVGLIFTVIFGIIAVMGIMERRGPKLTGLTIDLNSGYTHTFFSSDKRGIEELFTRTFNALDKEEVFVADFQNGKIEFNYMENHISNSQNVSIVGNNNSNVNTNMHIQANSLTSLNDALASHGIAVTDIQELNEILKSEQPNHSQKRFGDRTSAWISKIVGSGIAITEGVIAQYIAHFYGWA